MAFTKIAAAGIGSTETVTLHSLEVLNNATVGGVLTYEDVTNVDSIGIITARAGVLVGSGITLSKDGDIFATGVTTATKFVGDGSELTGVASTENIRTNTNATFLQNINVSGTSTVGGDVNIADKIVDIGDTNTAVRFPAADTVTVETGGSERLRIDSSGRLGIGTASGTRGLNVEGTGNASRAFFNDSSNHKAVEFGADSNGSFQSTIGDNPHLIYTNGTERARFTSDGLKFADGKGIDFSSRSGSAAGSTSALFDDYEEGTWTPSFSAGETLSIYSARYTKIGRLVTANCYIYNFSDLSGNTNSFQIEGLPYTASGSNYHGGGFIGYAAAMNYGYPLLPLVAQNGTYGYFHRQDATGSAWRYVDMHNVSNGQSGQLIVTFVYETAT